MFWCLFSTTEPLHHFFFLSLFLWWPGCEKKSAKVTIEVSRLWRTKRPALSSLTCCFQSRHLSATSKTHIHLFLHQWLLLGNRTVKKGLWSLAVIWWSEEPFINHSIKSAIARQQHTAADNFIYFFFLKRKNSCYIGSSIKHCEGVVPLNRSFISSRPQKEMSSGE